MTSQPGCSTVGVVDPVERRPVAKSQILGHLQVVERIIMQVGIEETVWGPDTASSVIAANAAMANQSSG